MQAGCFLRTLALTAIAAAAIVALFNATIDPYLFFGTPRVAGLNSRKPAVDSKERSMKLYETARAAPNALVLGSSVSDFGISPRASAWPSAVQPVYNLSVQGGGPYASLRYLQHEMSQRRFALVVLTLDFELFLKGVSRSPAPDLEARFAIDNQGQRNRHYDQRGIRDFAQTTFSANAFTDSVATLLGNLGSDSSDLLPDGNWSSRLNRRDMLSGARSRIALMDLFYIQFLMNEELESGSMAAVQRIIELCQSHNSDLIIIINPVHAGQGELRRILGRWQLFEAWTRQLTRLAASRRSFNNPKTALWDFSFSPLYSTEPIPDGKRTMQWFIDRTHYTEALGNVVIQQVFTAGHVGPGTLLTPETLEPALQANRDHQERYRSQNPAEVQRIQNLYRSFSRAHNGK
jgi:hypothetical protein